ncbi:Heat stress transcription factor B-4c [Platanthera guangdongensis]|uniref:Heat stress transcription factor B-4c n=1 Tax=Platanthera guangdongensis TaxID=2320717 RepID=A0ABR2M675_9ASPA
MADRKNLITDHYVNGRLLLFGNNGEPAGGGSLAEVALLEENERLRRGNEALISELAHMRRLYNDIIYFVQNHVRPVVPSSARPLIMTVTSRSAVLACIGRFDLRSLWTITRQLTCERHKRKYWFIGSTNLPQILTWIDHKDFRRHIP